MNMMQSVYEQENISMKWRDSVIVVSLYPFIKRSETSRSWGLQRDKTDVT